MLKQLFDKKHVVLSLVRDNTKFKAVSFIITRFNKHLFWIDMYDESKMINLFNYINLMSKNPLKIRLLLILEEDYIIIKFQISYLKKEICFLFQYFHRNGKSLSLNLKIN